MLRFTLFGIPVQVQPWFWLTMVIVGGGMYVNTKEAMIELVLFMVAGFVSIMVHELGHALTGQVFGARSRITLMAFGGVAEFSGAWFGRKQSFWVTAAGPGAQILLGLLGVVVWLGIPKGGLPEYFCFWLSAISVFWAVLNLVPVLPLDGGQMLNALMGPERVKTTLWVSVLAAGAAAIVVYRITGSILFPVLIGYFGFQSWKSLQAEGGR
ncbi:MAG: site-2 protease family protein [Akkermansiaceae bacterium]|nr:site-2 protease family protein [Akkermansiaceae bacterium]MCF7731173.1 site-2 protease family protein [Akkermansiaceae bacterium]